MDILLRIKSLAFHRQVEFTHKALEELEDDGLTVDDAIESIVNATRIDKVIRSRSAHRRHAGEKLYIIRSRSFGGTLIYTKGAIVQDHGRETFYVFVSAKIDASH